MSARFSWICHCTRIFWFLLLLLFALLSVFVFAADKGTRGKTEGHEASTRELIELLEKRKKADGRDNAMIQYLRADFIAEGLKVICPTDKQLRLLDEVLRSGWGPVAKKDIEPLLDSWQPVVEEIRKGTDIEYCRGFDWSMGDDTPVPNYEATEFRTKLICAEGLRAENDGKISVAMAYYQMALKYGSDLALHDAILINRMASISSNLIALRQMDRLLSSGKLSFLITSQTLVSLNSIERKQETPSDALRAEYRVKEWFFSSIQKYPPPIREKMKFIEQHPKDADEVLGHMDHYKKASREFLSCQMEFLKTPYWKRDRLSWKKKLDGMRWSQTPLQRLLPDPSAEEVDVRWRVMISRLHQTRLSAALGLYKIKNLKYPEHIQNLVPAYLVSLPQDPFTGVLYAYEVSADCHSYKISSSGPDSIPNPSNIYDATNGTVSEGDIIINSNCGFVGR